MWGCQGPGGTSGLLFACWQTADGATDLEVVADIHDDKIILSRFCGWEDIKSEDIGDAMKVPS